MCRETIEVQTMRNNDPECPEMLTLPSGASIGAIMYATAAFDDLRIIFCCSPSCLHRLAGGTLS